MNGERFAVPREDVFLRVATPRAALDAEHQRRLRRAFAALRFGVESGDPGFLELARSIVLAAGGDRFGLRRHAVGPTEATFETSLLTELRELFENGRLVVEPKEVAPLSDARLPELPELPPLPPPPKTPGNHSFELRLVDEIGQGIPGVDAEFSVDRQTLPTNAAGVALLDGVAASSASVSITDVEALAKVLDPRWTELRKGSPPKEGNLTTVVFRGLPLGPFPLKAELPNTVVVTPPLGKLSVELWDKRGRRRHANRRYSISGPMEFSGVTDENGLVEHDPVPGGDYELTLFLEPEPDETPFESQTITVPLVTLAPAESAPQVRLVGAVPSAVLVRLLGAFFDTNKSFLLPEGVESLAPLDGILRDNNPSQLLVVGHTDTTADPKTNDPLSLERARQMIAFLKDDVDTWLKNYDSVPAGARWGSREDQAMLSAVDDFPAELDAVERIKRFQKSRQLDVDGVAGKQTRTQLIKEYMALDAATLGDEGFDIPVTAHGCGENFPLDDGGEDLDQAPADDKEDGLDRRVELFFFDRDLGPVPPPPGDNSPAGSTAYPEWRKQAASTLDIKLAPARRVQLVDEAGFALVLEPYELVTADGTVLSGTADEDGVVVLPPGIGNEVTLRLTSMVAEVALAVV
jgi:hypothetical protein